MNSKNQQKKKEIDWMITLVPLALIVALCIVFFFAPEQSNQHSVWMRRKVGRHAIA